MGAAATNDGERGRAGLIFALGVALLAGGALAACEEEQLGPPRSSGTSGSGGSGGGIDVGPDGGGPPPLDAGGLCGNQLHQVITNAPNVYFVLDASGSMAAPAGSTTRFERVHDAAVQLVHDLGPLIQVGAALFPIDEDGVDACHAGDEVFPVTPGDPYIPGQLYGPTTLAFRNKTDVQPFGGTPTAATLEALAPKLAALSGETIVLLATDGGPNCNAEATCTADECMANIEGLCDPSVNCCAPGGAAGPENCLDRGPAVAAVEAIAAAGVDVYVIGIPGSETYGGVLDEMALAGGAPQLVAPFYYRVDDFDTLGELLTSIAAVVISCEFDLVDPPPAEGNTNVYLDQTLLPYGDANGWIWKSPAVVELRGAACQSVKTGKVRQIQIVSGCPTEVAE